nr:MAG TPA: hypothetical protein [Microviridae sp.]
MTVYLSGCPIPFHDLIELFDYLRNLSVTYLYQYQCADIIVNGVPRMYIMILYVNNVYKIRYVCYH